MAERIWPHPVSPDETRLVQKTQDIASTVTPHTDLDTVRVLAIFPSKNDQVAFEHILSHTRWIHFVASSLKEAQKILACEAIAVVVCDRLLPDGTWKDLKAWLEFHGLEPRLIVVSDDVNDQLWAEVYNMGGYDMLIKPLDRLETLRLIILAWLDWKRSRHSTRRPVQAVAGSR